MDGAKHSGGSAEAGGFRAAPRNGLPRVSGDERAFWRRAVEAERARQDSERPPPFPFQPA